MLIPVPYKIRCRFRVEPVVRQFCVAPYDGLLETTLVEPGDMVARGSLLARMDAREIRLQLAGLAADTHRAAKERDAHRARHEVADALMAELKIRQLESQAKLLGHREANLEVNSPIDGIVLSGSLDRRENFPVTTGQVLYEIAPLDPLRLELAVPSDEIAHVRPGMTVEARFDGVSGKPIRGEVGRIQPRCTIRDSENIVVAEVQVPNRDGLIRPGMQGFAKIIGQERSLAWILFHRPVEHAVSSWRW
jgi:multidrug efflux pump subunit AcrA (membrane-fusion protein)